jgi:hypothetical protein
MELILCMIAAIGIAMSICGKFADLPAFELAARPERRRAP